MLFSIDKWLENKLGAFFFDLAKWLCAFAIAFSIVLALGIVIAWIKAR